MNDDQGVIYVVIEHFARHLYPRALEMERKLYAGERLSDSELGHVEEVIKDTRLLWPLVVRHPEHHEFAGRVFALYTSISRRAWQNETRKAEDRP